MLRDGATNGQHAQLTGHKPTDDLALRIYQSIPVETRRANRAAIWRLCINLASKLRNEPPFPATIEYETAYRRGFFHGMTEAIEALDRGADAASLDQFLMGGVNDWRGDAHKGAFHAPPVWRAGEEVGA